MSYQTLLNSVFSLPVFTEELISISPTNPCNSISNFELFMTFDQDMHVLPALDFENESEDYFTNLFFSFEDYPVISGFFKILAVAMQQDIESRVQQAPSIDNPIELINKIIETNNYPTVSGDFSIVHDDNGGELKETLSLSFKDNGVYVKVNAFDGLRFRTYYGGGKKHRVRNALLMICYIRKQGF